MLQFSSVRSKYVCTEHQSRTFEQEINCSDYIQVIFDFCSSMEIVSPSVYWSLLYISVCLLYVSLCFAISLSSVSLFVSVALRLCLYQLISLSHMECDKTKIKIKIKTNLNFTNHIWVIGRNFRSDLPHGVQQMAQRRIRRPRSRCCR